MTESPGWINSTPLIEECAEAIDSAGVKWLLDKSSAKFGWADVPSNVFGEAVLSVLRRRGLINETGLELIQREMGE